MVYAAGARMQIQAASGVGSRGENADLGGERRRQQRKECRSKRRAAEAGEKRTQT